MSNSNNHDACVAVFTGGQDRPYALGLASALAGAGLHFDFIGSDEVGRAELQAHPQVNFLNLRGDQNTKAGLAKKIRRVLTYYARLIRYAATARPKTFHILWNNKFEFLDRTILMAFYRLLGKRVVLTAHNINAARRDGNDSVLNRLTLKMQYQLCDHIFVHTAKMRDELCAAFGVRPDKTSVIPLGINHTVPNTALTPAAARQHLGFEETDKVILFFGQIAPYKGLEYLVAAFLELEQQNPGHRLMIVGRPKGSPDYWQGIHEIIAGSKFSDRILQKIEFVPDSDTELYFKAAGVLVLPYTNIFQSGMLSLAYSFGLPVIAADVGSLKEEIIEEETGFVFEAKNVTALVLTLRHYFNSRLHENLNASRPMIQNHGNEKYSWTKVAGITTAVYSKLAPAAEGYFPRSVLNK